MTADLTDDDNDDEVRGCGCEEQAKVWSKIIRSESSSYCSCNDLRRKIASSQLRIIKKSLTAKVPGIMQYKTTMMRLHRIFTSVLFTSREKIIIISL